MMLSAYTELLKDTSSVYGTAQSAEAEVDAAPQPTL